MKTKIKILLMFSGIITLTQLSALNAIAQFSTASATQYVFSSGTVGVQNTGNDNWNFSGFDVEVHVYDADYGAGYQAGLYWEESNGTFSGSVALGGASVITDAMDPDVCLVTSSSYSVLNAVVVYYSLAGDGTNGSGFYYETYSYSSPTFSLASGPTFLQAASSQGVINIDADENPENYGIVFEDFSNSIIYLSTGSIASPACTPTQYVVDAAMPDISLYAGANCSCERAVITYVYTSASLGLYPSELEISVEDVANICPGTYSPTATYQSGTPSATYNYYYPRVACASGGGLDIQWSVIAEYNDGSSDYEIHGWTNDPTGPTVTPHIYNDGSEDPFYPITAVPNLRPVVDYSDNAIQIFVGWTFNNIGDPQSYSSGGAIDARYPVVLSCDYYGTAVTGTNYWDVPTSVANNDDYSTLSISGRHDRFDMLYTYYDNINSDPYFKRVPPWAASLRESNITSTEEYDIKLYPNPFSENLYLAFSGIKQSEVLSIKIFDITGNEIVAYSGNGEELIRKTAAASSKLSQGMYLFKIYSQNLELQRIEKLVKL